LERGLGRPEIVVQRATTWREAVEDGCGPQNTIFIVSCTKNKIWDRRDQVPLYVEAQQAYAGHSISTFLDAWSDLKSRGFRWLILSAKYGLIEPHHPIHNYDVAFSLAKTGPISQASIAGQFCCQERYWIESNGEVARYVPHDYSRLVVVASGREPNLYLERISRTADWHNEQRHQPSIKRLCHWVCD